MEYSINPRAIIQRLANEVLKTEDISLNEDLKSVGMDSINLVSYMINLEKVFGIELYDSDLSEDNFASLLAVEETIKKYILFRDENDCKCIVLDADGILWDGTAGEDDRVSITNKHMRFHQALRETKESGVLLFLCTSNTESNISSILADYSISELFAGEIYNAQDKAQAVSWIMGKTHFLPRNILFVDDNPRNCSEVEYKHPELPVYYVSNIENLTILFRRLSSALETNNARPTDRTLLFKQQMLREEVQTGNAKKTNQLLETRITCRSATLDDIPRLCELSKRAHRFTLSGVYRSIDCWSNWIANKEYRICVLSAKDKYGDLGIVAFSVVHKKELIEFVVSCRALHRGFEDVLYNYAVDMENVGIKEYEKTGELAMDFFNRKML